MGGWFKEYKPGDPVRLVANVEETNRVHRILDDLQGIGCRIEKPRNANGRGWRIIVDGTSDLDPIPDSDVGTDTGQIPVKPYDLKAYGVPVGGIIMWSGLLTSIPPLYALCDGTNGTPNLSGKFILGAVKASGATDTVHTIAVGALGGTPYNVNGDHTHATDAMFESDTLYIYNDNLTTDPTDFRFPTNQGTDIGVAQIPYYALAFIMRLEG